MTFKKGKDSKTGIICKNSTFVQLNFLKCNLSEREVGYLVSCTIECIKPNPSIRVVRGAALIDLHVISAQGAVVVGG
jgi:hypothetical protein